MRQSYSTSWRCDPPSSTSRKHPCGLPGIARARNQRTAECLLGTPLVGDFLEEGLSMLGYSCEEFEIERL